MEYIAAAFTFLFIPLFVGSMLLVAFWGEDTGDVQDRQQPREQAQQSPVKEIESQPSPVPQVADTGKSQGSGYSTGTQRTAEAHGDDERRRRRRKRRN